MFPASRNLLNLTLALALTVAAPVRADEESFYEAGKKSVNKILDIFSSSSWLESGRGAESPPAKVDASEVVQNGLKVEPADKDKKNPPEGAPDSGPPPRSGRARALPLWMPMCFLFDPSHDPTTVNKNMKKLVDEYGRCGIAVETFAFTVQDGYPQDVQQLNGLVRQACDFDRAFGVRGAIQMGVNSAQIPQTMCREPGAQGCSTLCERLSVSYLAPGAGPETAVHESLHSNCCGRLCVNAGEGTQGVGYNIDLVDNRTPILNWNQAEPADKPDLANAKEEEQQLDQEACVSLRQGASPNDGTHRYDPNKLNFYARASGAAQKPLDGRSFFTAKSGKTPEAGHPAGGGGEGGEAGKRLGSVSFDDNAKKVASAGNGVPGKPKEDKTSTPDSRHKNGAGAGIDPIVQQLMGNLKGLEDDAGDNPENIQFTNPAKPAPPSGGSTGSSRVVFDDNAKKGGGGGGGGQNLGGAGGSKPLSGAGDLSGGSSLSFGGEGGGTNIIGADGNGGNSLDGSFFDQIKDTQGAPSGERPRGSSLRPRDLSSLKRESNSGVAQRTDVLISSRPDPARIAPELKPAPVY